MKRRAPTKPRTIDEQIRLCEIPAPPFKEAARAEAYAEAMRAAGLRNVRIDKEGNVLGERPGRAARPHLLFSAHLDTVFPEGTDVKVTRQGSMLRGPGIGDDCRGLAVVLAVVRALNRGNVETPGTITFVGTVGEEGLGDLRGMKALFTDTLKGQVDRFVSVDGIGLGITHSAVGSLRYRVTFSGPGGHSYGAFGIANPIHALGRAIAGLADAAASRRSEDDVRGRANRGRDIGERHRGGGVDGGRHALGRPGGVARARREVSRGGRQSARRRERPVGTERIDPRPEGACRKPPGRRRRGDNADRAGSGIGNPGVGSGGGAW